MSDPARSLRDDALRIWQAGVDAVRSERLVADAVRVEGTTLHVGPERIDLERVRRIEVVGGGKAGAGMAAALEEALSPEGGPDLLAEKNVSGWLNVPADCVRPLRAITLHAARPAGHNEPTAEGAAGSEEILRRVAALGEDDLCLCLLSGGGSALMPAPAEGVTLEDKQRVTRFLSGAGANIQQLNTVRKQLSRIKGGGLLRACRAGRLITLIISDVIGDPLDVIASGPTVEDPAAPADALRVLEDFAAPPSVATPAVLEQLRDKPAQAPPPTCRATNLVIGNNAAAVAAAGAAAEQLGYTPQLEPAERLEGEAETVGRALAARAIQMRDGSGPDCLISGGEPVVKLVDAEQRGLGGRNQQLALAALEQLGADGTAGVVLLSGGTDGEDGPTDAAGAVADAGVWRSATEQGLQPADYLERNDAYHFFASTGGLIKTGPTHTNVCDVRVVLVERRAGGNR